MNLEYDEVYKFLDACHKAGIRDPWAYLRSKRPKVYDWLVGAFPRGILPTDIDGEVEINGFFLRLEFKQARALQNGWMPGGQMKAFYRLVQTGFFTVFVVGVGENEKPTCMQWQTRQAPKLSKLRESNEEDIRRKCTEWSEWAESQPSVAGYAVQNGGINGEVLHVLKDGWLKATPEQREDFRKYQEAKP